ncbi:MAG: sigma-70 family RNA polymerase sigma factor [Ferruginibacter sp.]
MKKENAIGHNKWELLLSQDEVDFYKCFQLCYDDLYRLGLFLYKDKELVKEGIQLLFIELWKMREKLIAVKNIKEYVLTIFRRILYKQKTASVKRWSKIALPETIINENDLSTESYEEILIVSQDSIIIKDKLINALPQLAGRQLQLIMLRYFDEKSIDEIAVITSLTPRTIYNTLHNALNKLKDIMT